MAQPPAPTRYGLITDSEDDFRLSQERIDQQRLATERSNQQKAAEKRRQEALDQHLSQYADDPISKAVATIEFEKTEAEENRKAQIAARQKEHDKISAKYDDPIAQAWAIMQHDDEQAKNLGPKQAFADREALQKLNEREDTTRKLDWVGKTFGLGIGDAFVRETAGSAVNVVPDLAAVPARAMEAVGIAEPGTADELHRGSEAFQQGRQEARRDDLSPWLSRMYGGASQSALQMAATPGGATSKIVAAGVMSGDAALTTGKDAGLEGADLARYAGTQGLLEAGVAAIGQKIFGPGIESRMAGQAVAAETMKQLAKNIGKDALKEMPEEVVTSILQDISSKYEGVSPDMTINDFVSNSIDAAVQSALMAGMANAPNAARLPFQKKQPVFPDQQPAEDPNSFTQIPIDEMIQRRDAAAGSQPPVPPEIDAFTKNPSRTKYNAAVKAGMPPLETSNETTRKKYADDWMKDPLGMRKKMVPSTPTQDPATLEPSMESPPATVAVDEQQPLTEEPNGQESDVQGIQGQREDGIQSDGTQGTQGEEGRQELLTESPAGTQVPAPPAAVNESPTPAAHTTKESFTKEYEQAIEDLYDDEDAPGLERLAALWESNPEWAKEIDDKKTPPVVAPGGALPDQSSSPMADPVSSNETPKQLTKDEHAKLPMFDVYPLQRKDGTKFAVKESDKSGFGDAFFSTEDEARKHADIVRQQSEERAAQLAKDQADEEAATKKQKEHEASFQGFLTDDPKTKGRRLKTLDSALNYKNKPTTRKALVEQKVSDGWTVNDQDQLQAPTGEFLDARDLTKTGIDYARHLVSKSSNSEKAVPWRRTVDEERPAYNKRLKKEGWTPSPKPDISVIDSPGTIKSISLEQQKKSPYKKGDRVTVHTGFSTDEMQIGGEVLEDSLPESTSVKIRVDSGKVHNVMAYYIGNENKAKTRHELALDADERKRQEQAERMTAHLNPKPAEPSAAEHDRLYKERAALNVPPLGASNKEWSDFKFTPTTPVKPVKPVKPAKPPTVADERSIRKLVKAQGGISTKSVNKDYNRKELNGDGMLGVIRIKGQPLDEIAQMLVSSGDLRVPENRTPADWLMEQLIGDADSARAEYTDAEIEAQLEAERKLYDQRKEYGFEAEVLDGLRERSEEAETLAVDAGQDDFVPFTEAEAAEIIDTSFDFGANVEAKADEDAFTLKRPEKPKPKAQDFGTNPNSKQGGLFDAGKKGDKKGQELLFNSDPGDLNNPRTQENKAKAEDFAYGDVIERIDDPKIIGRFEGKHKNGDLIVKYDGSRTTWTKGNAKPSSVVLDDQGRRVQPPAQSQPEPSQEDLMEQILREELLGEKPGKPKPEKTPKTKPPVFESGKPMTRDTVFPDLIISGKKHEVPGRTNASYLIEYRKPDIIPDIFRATVYSEGIPGVGFITTVGTGMTTRQAYDNALAEFDRQLLASKPPRKPRTEAAKKRTEKTAAELKAAEDDVFKAFGSTMNTGLNADQMRATARLVKAALNHNVSTFNEFVAYVVDTFKEPMALRMAEGIELAWRALKRLPEYSGIDDAGKVADVIAQKTETSDESGNTGNDDTEGREEDSGASPADSGDTQNADSPADAEVLGDEQAENDGKTKKPRSSSSVRRGSRRKLRSGDGQADSGTGNESERSVDDGGGTSSDDPGTGRDSAPQSTRPNYHLTNPEAIIGGGPKAKFERNRKAIEIVRTLEEQNRTPTSEELDTLAGYMGWGAFGQELFKGSWTNPQPKEGWEEHDEWLRIYLGEAEWKSAQDSIVNAHFTDPQTVTAVWGMLRRLGFKGGRVLEPSVGVGNFFSLMPRDLMERSALTGIELDKITAKIAKLLHPNANIQQKGYQESQTPDNFYDVIVSNVPFGDYSIPDRRYKQDFSIHNYFFKKAFDQLKPGGVIAFLTSNMTMDGKVQAKLMRAQIANQGDLVTAIRLPSGAFQAYAGTKVVADLIVIRKRKPKEQPAGQPWIQINELQTDGNEDHALDVNEYWLNNPDKILGTMTWGHGTTTGRPGMIVNQPSDLQASLDAAIASVPENIINTERGKSEGRERANTTARRQNSILSESGDLWQVKGEHLVPLLDAVAWYRKGSKQSTIDKNRKEIETLLHVREAVREVLDKQAASENADSARAELNKTYDAFVKEFGPIGKSAAGKHLRKAGDPMGHALLALESVSGLVFKKYTKRPIFTRATVRQKRNIDNPTLNDAFALERNRSLDLDIDRIAVAANMPVDAVIKKLVAEGRIYKTGNGTYDAADVFLSGNMARKLRQLEASQAEGMDGLDESIEAVRERIPTPVPYSQIEAKLGATWITSEDYANYVGALVNEPGEQITVERRIQGWKVTIPTSINGKAEATTLHGHPGIDFNKLVAAAMNNATVRITMPDPDDRTKRITDPVGTEEANAKLSELRDNFSTWLWSDSDRIARLSSVYNEEFNSTVTPDFDDVPLDFEGMAIERGDKPFNLRQHQASAVWRGIVSGKGIFAHEVGTGKTLTMAALAMENRRLGLASKPILLAHNANSLAVRNEIQEAYPGANILYVDNMDSANKDTMLQSIATEDWDLIVVPHSMAEKFMLRPETVEALLKPEMDALEAAALEAFEESQASEYAKGSMPENLDEISDEDMQALREPTAKELVKERMKLRAQIVKAQQAMGEGKGIFFEDMGIDMVMVDEAHLFKKLPITSKQRIKGLNKSASQMGNMMMMMTDYIRMNNKGRGVYLFTGTPITNTVNEVFNMMRFVMAEEMESSGVRSWDGWFNNFATQDTMTELSSGGTWENFDRIASFVNLPELRQMVGQYMDIVFADDMEEFKPRESREGRTENPIGRPFKQVHNVIIDMLDAQRSLSEQLAARYITFRDAEGRDKVRMMREPGGQFNPLVIEGEGVKLAMDPRLTGYGTKLVDDKMVTDDSVLNPRDPNLKINKMIRNGMQHYNEHPKSAQMIFMQVGYTDSVERVVGRNDDGKPIKERFRVFNLAKEIKRRLMEEGVAENEIAIFSGLSKEKRAEAALMMRKGEIRFAIGSTETMGTGVNAQDELVAMHHLDAPWMPGDLEQRNGRGHRQGNQWNTVHEYRYLTEGPQDGRRWQVLLTKDKFIKDFMRGDAKARTIEMDDVDMSEDGEGTDMEQTFSAAAGDPRIMQRIRLEGQVEKLIRQRDNYAQMITDTARKAGSVKREIGNKTSAIARLQSLYDTWKSNRTEEPEVTINGTKYTGSKDITFELQNLADRYSNKMHDAVEIGDYRGIPLYAVNGELHVGNMSTIDSLQVWRLGTNNPNVVTARWNYQSLQAIMSNLPDRIAKQRTTIEKDQQFIDMAQRSANEPFPKKKQLESKQNKLEAIKAEMAANPDVSPPWLRSGAPIGTSVYWKGEKYDVAGHRGDDKVLFADGDLFQVLPAAELTDAEGTPLFPDIYAEPAATPDAATPAADAPVVSEARQAAIDAKYALEEQRAKNWKQNEVIWHELRNLPPFIGAQVPKALARAVLNRMLGEVKAGVKTFDLLIKNLRADFSESDMMQLKPTLIAMWNVLREKKGLLGGVVTETDFDDAIANNADTEVDQVLQELEAVTETPPAESQNSDPPIAEPSTPTPDPATRPAAAGDGKEFSPKNEFTDSERERLGMPKRVPLGPHRRQIDIDLARAEINSVEGNARIDATINYLMETGRAPSAYETALLNARYTQLDNKYEAALRAKVDAASKGDDVQAALHSNLAEKHLNEQMALLTLESTTASHALGAGLQARKDLINRDYTMARSVLEFESAFKRKPDKPGEMEAIQKMVDDVNASNERLRKLLDEASEDIESLEARLKEAHEGKIRKAREVKPSDQKKPPSEKTEGPRQKAAREKIENAYKRLQQLLKVGTAFSFESALYQSGSVFFDLAAGYSELGVINLGDFLNRVGKRMGPAAKQITAELTEGWNAFRATVQETDLSHITDQIDPTDPDTIGRAARGLHSFVIERDGLDGSPEGREAAVVAVHGILVDFVPELTLEETARAMSGIGIYSELSDDQIEAIRRDQKAQLLILEQIKAWRQAAIDEANEPGSGVGPLPTGQQRAEQSDEQRALKRINNEAKKASGIATTSEGQLRSALDAAKRMVQNRIADLTKAIKENNPIKRSKTVLEDPSGELGRLQARRDELQKEYNEAFGKNKLSDEQRLNAAEKALDRAIANLEADLKEGKLYPDDPMPQLTSPAIEAKQATLDALKASREELRLSSGEAEARSDAAYERKLKERNAELARRLAEGDFKPKPKKPERKLTPELLKEMRINEKLKIEMLKKRKEWLFSQKHVVYRAFKKGVVGPIELWRKMMTAFDASLIGRQGRLLGGANPKIYGKAIAKAFATNIWDAKSIFPTEQDLFNTQAALDADDNWVRMEKIGKLAVTDVHGGVNREEGNQWSPEWADKVIPGLASSERSGSAFINTQRRLVFRSLVEKLARMHESDGGGMHTISASELRAIGNMINVASGRGDIGSWLNGVEGVSILFFAPRWTASRVMWLVGEPLWHEARWRGGEGASPQVRKLLAVEWAKQAAAQAVFTGFVLGTMYALIGPPGDDEEWDFYWDARSPYFGQLRYRNTYLDMTAGVSQFVSTMSRLITGTQANRWDGVVEADRGRIAGRYLQGKLAPVPSVPADFIWGPMDPTVKAGSGEWLKGKVLPLMAQDAEQAMGEGKVVGPALMMLAFLGNNSRTQEERVKKRAETLNEIGALQKQNKPERVQQVLNEHLKHAAKTEATQQLRTADPDEVAGIQKVIDGVESPELMHAMKKEKFDISLRALQMLSTEDLKKEKSATNDKAINTSRSLLKAIAPTFEDADALFREAYKYENGSLVEKVGNRYVVKKSVQAARMRLKKLYAD